MRRIIFLSLLAILTLSAVSGLRAAAKTPEQQLKRIKDRLHSEAVARGDTAWLNREAANDALRQYVTDSGYLNACGALTNEPDLHALAREWAAWTNPGLWAWATGAQSKEAEFKLSLLRSAYNIGKIDGISEGCGGLTVSTKKITAEGYKQVFEQYLGMEGS